jgi:hypothetical protein
MDVQKEISLRNAISYCIENNDVNTATNRIMEFIRDKKEAINYTHCCTELKIKERINFIEWINDNCLETINGEYIYKNSNYDLKGLKKIYKLNYSI